MALEMVTWEVSNTNQGLLPYIFLQVKHGDLPADEYSQTWRAMMRDTWCSNDISQCEEII